MEVLAQLDPPIATGDGTVAWPAIAGARPLSGTGRHDRLWRDSVRYPFPFRKAIGPELRPRSGCRRAVRTRCPAFRSGINRAGEAGAHASGA